MQNLTNCSVLVTGGAGFIGSHLSEMLLNMGARVICVDNLFTGKMGNIKPLLQRPNFVFLNCNVNIPADLQKVFSENKIDYIFHYAAVLGVQRVTDQPLLVLPDIQGMHEICSQAKAHGVKKVIFASSSEAYGDTAELPLKEDNSKDIANHSHHTHLYALVKLIGERIMRIYNDTYGLPTVSLRFFNVYGPRQESSPYGFVAGVFIRQLLKGDAPTIYGDGYQTRDFIYVQDNIDIAIKALFADSANGQVINVGTGRQTTILDLAERLIKISGKNVKPKFLEGRKYEIRYRSPDVTKMMQILGGRIEDRFDEHLRETYEWYRANA